MCDVKQLILCEVWVVFFLFVFFSATLRAALSGGISVGGLKDPSSDLSQTQYYSRAFLTSMFFCVFDADDRCFLRQLCSTLRYSVTFLCFQSLVLNSFHSSGSKAQWPFSLILLFFSVGLWRPFVHLCNKHLLLNVTVLSAFVLLPHPDLTAAWQSPLTIKAIALYRNKALAQPCNGTYCTLRASWASHAFPNQEHKVK